MTTEALPRPRAAIGVVFADVVARTLTVRLSEGESGYTKLLWREGWQALRRAQEAGWPPGGPPGIWADVPGGRRVVHGQPVDGGMLSFHFPPGAAGYTALIAKPGVRAIIVMDASSRRILSVTFRSGSA